MTILAAAGPDDNSGRQCSGRVARLVQRVSRDPVVFAPHMSVQRQFWRAGSGGGFARGGGLFRGVGRFRLGESRGGSGRGFAGAGPARGSGRLTGLSMRYHDRQGGVFEKGRPGRLRGKGFAFFWM